MVDADCKSAQLANGGQPPAVLLRCDSPGQPALVWLGGIVALLDLAPRSGAATGAARGVASQLAQNAR